MVRHNITLFTSRQLLFFRFPIFAAYRTWVAL